MWGGVGVRVCGAGWGRGTVVTAERGPPTLPTTPTTHACQCGTKTVPPICPQLAGSPSCPVPLPAPTPSPEHSAAQTMHPYTHICRQAPALHTRPPPSPTPAPGGRTPRRPCTARCAALRSSAPRRAWRAGASQSTAAPARAPRTGRRPAGVPRNVCVSVCVGWLGGGKVHRGRASTWPLGQLAVGSVSRAAWAEAVQRCNTNQECQAPPACPALQCALHRGGWPVVPERRTCASRFFGMSLRSWRTPCHESEREASLLGSPAPAARAAKGKVWL